MCVTLVTIVFLCIDNFCNNGFIGLWVIGASLSEPHIDHDNGPRAWKIVAPCMVPARSDKQHELSQCILRVLVLQDLQESTAL